MIRAEEPFQFPISAEKSVSISDKLFESDSKAMKIRVKVAYSCLTLSKKPPPPFFHILATRQLGILCLHPVYGYIRQESMEDLPMALYHQKKLLKLNPPFRDAKSICRSWWILTPTASLEELTTPTCLN